MELPYVCVRCWRAGRGSQATKSIQDTRRSLSQWKLPQKSRLLQPRLPSPSVAVPARRPFGQAVKETPKKEEDFTTPGSLLDRYLYGQTAGVARLGQDNLFHPFSKSPIAEIRQRSHFLKRNAYCPHPSHHRTRVPQSPNDPEARKLPGHSTEVPLHVNFECPDCGIATYCSEEHWMDDYENHLEICDTLRQINEDDHDLRSGRAFTEFDYPPPIFEDIIANMTSWDTFLYTRQFEAINSDQSMRQATRLLTFPITLASILHEHSPYSIRDRLTVEGLKSLSALRYTLHPRKDGAGEGFHQRKLRAPTVRIFVLGARAESSLPREVWLQLAWVFQRATFNIIFIGPESMANRDAEYPLPQRTPINPFGAVTEGDVMTAMKFTTYVDYFHTLHEARHFYPYDPYFDCFVLFHPGLGHPTSIHEWADTLPQLLETKCPVICTGYSEWDMKRDWEWVSNKCKGEVDLLMHPGENRFRSLRWDLNDLDPQDVSCGNWGVWAFRGKRYEAISQETT